MKPITILAFILATLTAVEAGGGGSASANADQKTNAAPTGKQSSMRHTSLYPRIAYQS